MAQFEEVIKLRTETQGANSVKSLKQEIREAQEDAIRLGREFGNLSPQATEAAKKVAQLRDEMGDFQQRVAALNPDRFAAIAKVTGALSGGISAATGAMALFGDESEDTQKALLKVQGAIAFSQGIQGILDLKNSLGGVATIAAALFAVLVASWTRIKGLIDGVSDAQEEMNEAAAKNLEIQEEKLTSLEDQDNVLRLQGKTELEILELKKAQSDEAIKAAEINLHNAEATKQAQVDAAKRNQAILTGILQFITLPLQLILNATDKIAQLFGKELNLQKNLNETVTKLIFDPEEVAAEGDKAIKIARDKLNELKNLNAGYQLQIREINNKSAEERKKERDKILEEQKGLNAAIQELEDAFQSANTNSKQRQREKENAEAEKEMSDRIERMNRERRITEAANKIRVEDEKKTQEAIKMAREAGFNATSQLLGNISQLFEQGSDAQKAFAIGQVLVDEAKAIAAVVAGAAQASSATGPAAPITFAAYVASGLATVASTFARVKSILKTGSSSQSQINAPTLTPVTSSFTGGSDEIAGRDVRVYVTEADITKTQDKVKRTRDISVV